MVSDKGNKGSLTQQLFRFDLANRRKLTRYVGSGLLIAILGAIVLWIGLTVVTKGSTEALVAGLGIIIVIIGVIRVLIGLIRPSVPEDLPPPTEPQPDTGALFAHEGDPIE